MSTPSDQATAQRTAPFRFDDQGKQVHSWNLTPPSITDSVLLNLGPPHILPIVFVPGIMGSNLRSNDGKKTPVWRLDMAMGLLPLNLIKKTVQGAGIRQKLLHPDRVEIDDGGAVPSEAVGSVSGPKDYREHLYRERGWGEIAEGSYHDFLLWLERTLNGQGWDPMTWSDYGLVDSVIGPVLSPGQKPAPYPPQLRMRVQGLPEGSQERNPLNLPLVFRDLQKRANYLMPVHACGYNWLDSNEKAAQQLARRIDEVMQRYGNRCMQVVVVTHSMGGLVTRRCAMLPGMADKIAGVVHGAMPATGAAVAYRRCKLGMADEVSGKDRIGALIIGNNGRETTAVFAQAPGALQLLPSGDYPTGWLRLCDDKGKPAMSPLPTANDPYTDIYLRKDRWWGLVREAWLAPQDGQAITWDVYKDNVDDARKFHAYIRNQYHDHTYVYYGADDKQPSFTNITWRMQPGFAPDGKPRPNTASVAELGMGDVRDDGSNPLHVGGRTVTQTTGTLWGSYSQTYETSYWELQCDTQHGAGNDPAGDGTVPRCSGRAPLAADNQARVREQFRLTGFGHEASYKNDDARRVTLYAITRIAGTARVPS